MATAKTIPQEEMRATVAAAMRDFADKVEAGEILPTSISTDHERGSWVLNLHYRKQIPAHPAPE